MISLKIKLTEESNDKSNLIDECHWPAKYIQRTDSFIQLLHLKFSQECEQEYFDKCVKSSVCMRKMVGCPKLTFINALSLSIES